MSVWSKLLGNTTASPIKAIGEVIDDIHLSGEEKLDAAQKLLEVKERLQSLQTSITQQEAAHRSVFIAGWRPGLAWLCISILFFNYLVVPLAGVADIKIEGIADPEHIENILLALGGLATIRMGEKRMGLTR